MKTYELWNLDRCHIKATDTFFWIVTKKLDTLQKWLSKFRNSERFLLGTVIHIISTERAGNYWARLQSCEKRLLGSYVMSAFLSVWLCVLPRGATRLPLKGLLCSFIFGRMIKIDREYSSVVKIEQNIRHCTWRSKYVCDNISLNSARNKNFRS